MNLKILTYATKQGEIVEQFLILNEEKVKIEETQIWEGEILKIGDKRYNLNLQDWRHGEKEGELDVFQYKLEEENAEIKDVTTTLIEKMGLEKFEKNFK